MAITRATGKIHLLKRTGAELHGTYHFGCLFQGMLCFFYIYMHNVYTNFCIENTCPIVLFILEEIFYSSAGLHGEGRKY